jgi:hypothetical protein
MVVHALGDEHETGPTKPAGGAGATDDGEAVTVVTVVVLLVVLVVVVLVGLVVMVVLSCFDDAPQPAIPIALKRATRITELRLRLLYPARVPSKAALPTVPSSV